MAFHGRVHHFEQGYWIKFEIARISPTPARPHGLRYAFTLHDQDGKRLLGFDNAHGVSRSKAGETEHDHWHRSETDEGRPYRFIDADTLLADFEKEVIRVLGERGVAYSVIAVDEIKKGGRP